MNRKRMKTSIILCFMMILTLNGCQKNNLDSDVSLNKSTYEKNVTLEATQSDNHEKTEKSKIVILGTGGTIAGTGEEGKETGYQSGALSVESLLTSVPGLEDIAQIETIQICNVNSDDITSKIWIQLTNTINEMAKDESIDGFVITHGTDTLEETAYFLNLTVKTDKPVVITGSMRPSTAISADGPMNLYQAVCTAASEESIGKGVLVVFSDRIIAARSVQKESTYNTMAISGGEMGNIGIIRNNTPFFYEAETKKHTTQTEFEVTELESLPNVNIVYFAVDSDPEILKYSAQKSDGLIIAGAGAGEFSEKYIEVINGLSIPVVISSRIDNGIITQDAVLCENTIAANNLSPQKAAVLLRLAIANGTTSKEELVDIFQKY